VRKVIEREFPQLAVLSYQELSPSANIQPLERVKLTAKQIRAA
jgi:type III secretion protein V